MLCNLSRGLITRRWSGLAPLLLTSGTECALRLRDYSSGRWQHSVDVARCSADWLSASAQCVVWYRAPAGGGAWQEDGSQRVQVRSFVL